MLSARDLRVRLGGRLLLRDVSAWVRPGEVVALVGPNGAGKSTLLRCLSGELFPEAGEVTLLGRPLAQWRPRARASRLAILPQQCRLAFPFTAMEVVQLGRLPHAAPAASEAAVAREALAATGCAHLETRLWPTLSGGEQQRVSLARVLCQLHGCTREEPGCLLLDEPVASLDLPHQHATLRHLRAFAQRGGGVLVSVHDLNLAAQHADRVLVLADGALLADGPPREALQPELIGRAFGTRALSLPHPVFDCQLIVALPEEADA